MLATRVYTIILGEYVLTPKEILYKPMEVVFCMMRNPKITISMVSIKMVPLIMPTEKEQHGWMLLVWSVTLRGIYGHGKTSSADEKNETHDLYKLNVLERPKVIYNGRTQKYVMWMHIDDTNYTKASVGVAVSDHPTGPFNYLYSIRPHGFDSRDMTIFKDYDGVTYLIYSSDDNRELHIGPLNEEYLDVTRVMREAPALFKHDITYYMITSGCTGWVPNEASESVIGPWETMGNPCLSGNKIFRLTTFFAQATYLLPLPESPGLFIFMADRWNPADLRDSRYVWLPLIVGGAADRPLDYNFGFPLWSRVTIFWHKTWRLSAAWRGTKS